MKAFGITITYYAYTTIPGRQRVFTGTNLNKLRKVMLCNGEPFRIEADLQPWVNAKHIYNSNVGNYALVDCMTNYSGKWKRIGKCYGASGVKANIEARAL